MVMPTNQPAVPLTAEQLKAIDHQFQDPNVSLGCWAIKNGPRLLREVERQAVEIESMYSDICHELGAPEGSSIYATYENLKAERDRLAVENAALKSQLAELPGKIAVKVEHDAGQGWRAYCGMLVLRSGFDSEAYAKIYADCVTGYLRALVTEAAQPDACKLCHHVHAGKCKEPAPNTQFTCACPGECSHGRHPNYCHDCQGLQSDTPESGGVD
ncbi:MAG TPA: hypothetical protein VJ801_14360 [Polyangia bacterium]|jgi:Homeobox associated leucine zipper.|nr:hypothetical protein [Polyangia bacterium]